MFQEIIVVTLIYIFVVGMLYAPKCPRYEAAGNAPIDYFPDAFEIHEEKLHTELVEFMLEVFDPTPEPIAKFGIAAPKFTDNLTELTSKELKSIAKEQKVKGYGSMKKSQLIAAISG